jgi:hypothetical protein
LDVFFFFARLFSFLNRDHVWDLEKIRRSIATEVLRRDSETEVCT